MPRALIALAMARNDVAPLAFICSMIGSTLAAKRSAFDAESLGLRGALTAAQDDRLF